jgi:excisionase family DNA binding protein
MTVANRSEQAKEALTYTPKQAAKVLGVGRDKAYELLRSGELRSVRVTRRWLIPREAITEFLARGKK